MKQNRIYLILALCVLIIMPLFLSRPIIEKLTPVSKGVILMYCTQNLLDKWGRYVVEINKKYAEKHGYDFEVIGVPYDEKVTHAWQKIPAMLDLIRRNYDFVMYIDSDAIFYDQSIKIEEILKKYKGDIIVCSDEKNSDGKYKVNGGAVIARNTTNAQSILKKWWDLRYEYKEFAFEQWALSDMVENKIEGVDASTISVAPETEFNSVYHEVKSYAENTDNSPPNRHVLHFMAMGDETREHVFSKLHKLLISNQE